MSATLQARAKAFVGRAVPKELDYAPGSIAERVIAQYAEAGALEAGSDFAELIELATMEAAAAVDRHDGQARAYMAESAVILEEITREMQAADEGG